MFVLIFANFNLARYLVIARAQAFHGNIIWAQLRFNASIFVALITTAAVMKKKALASLDRAQGMKFSATLLFQILIRGDCVRNTSYQIDLLSSFASGVELMSNFNNSLDVSRAALRFFLVRDKKMFSSRPHWMRPFSKYDHATNISPLSEVVKPIKKLQLATTVLETVFSL